MTEQIIVANKTDHSIRLVTYCNPVWEVVDIVTNAFVYIIQPWAAFSAFRAAAEARRIVWVLELLKSLETIWECSRLSNLVLAGAGAELVLDWGRLQTALTDTQALLTKHGVRVGSRERISVHEHNLWNLLWYLVPSGWASAFNSGNTYCMLILLEKGENPLDWRTAIVPTTALHNWVITLDGIYTAKTDGWTPDFTFPGVSWTPFHAISREEMRNSDVIAASTAVRHVEYKCHLIKLSVCCSTIEEAALGMIALLRTRGVHKGQVKSLRLQLTETGQSECRAYYDVNVLGVTTDPLHVQYTALSADTPSALHTQLTHCLQDKADVIGVNYLQPGRIVVFYHGYTTSAQQITCLVVRSGTLEQSCEMMEQEAEGCKQREIVAVDVFDEGDEGVVVVKAVLNKTLAETRDVCLKSKVLAAAGPVDVSEVSCSQLIDIVLYRDKLVVFYNAVQY